MFCAPRKSHGTTIKIQLVLHNVTNVNNLDMAPIIAIIYQNLLSTVKGTNPRIVPNHGKLKLHAQTVEVHTANFRGCQKFQERIQRILKLREQFKKTKDSNKLQRVVRPVIKKENFPVIKDQRNQPQVVEMSPYNETAKGTQSASTTKETQSASTVHNPWRRDGPNLQAESATLLEFVNVSKQLVEKYNLRKMLELTKQLSVDLDRTNN